MGVNRKFYFRQVWKFCRDLSNVISGGNWLFRWDCSFSGGTLYPSANYIKILLKSKDIPSFKWFEWSKQLLQQFFWRGPKSHPLPFKRLPGIWLSLFCRYYVGRYSFELAELVSLLYSRGRSTRYSNRLHNISVSIPRCYKDITASSLFSQTARHRNSLPVECFPLTCDLKSFTSRVKWRLLVLGFF